MITYTWNIFRLDCAPSENGLTNVVKVIHWNYTAQDENGITASFNNLYPLPEPTPEAFTDYSTLTEEIIIGWLENSLDVGYLKSELTNEIESQYVPPITSLPLPWIKVEEPVLEVIEEPVLEVVEEPVLEVVEEPVLEVIEEPVLEVIEEPILNEIIVEDIPPVDTSVELEQGV